jgi:hypothetical protein
MQAKKMIRRDRGRQEALNAAIEEKEKEKADKKEAGGGSEKEKQKEKAEGTFVQQMLLMSIHVSRVSIPVYQPECKRSSAIVEQHFPRTA